MRRSLCLLIPLVLLALTVSQHRPGYAQVTSPIVITVNPPTIEAPMNSRVTDVVTVTNTDPVNLHMVTLLLRGEMLYGVAVAQAYFSPETISVSPGGSATSVLTILVPDVCPGRDSPGPYSETLVVEARESGKNPWLSPIIGNASLVVNVRGGSPPSISLTSNKPSYMVGETLALIVNSNITIGYLLTISKPDGTTEASWAGMAVLPSTFTHEARRPVGEYTAQLEAYYCGTWHASAQFSVLSDTYEVTISLAGLPANVTATLWIDGSKVADIKGDEALVLTYPNGISHTFQVDQYVGDSRNYYSAENRWTAAAEGSHVFNYVIRNQTATPTQMVLSPSSATVRVDRGDRWWLAAIGVAVLALGSLATILTFRHPITPRTPRVCRSCKFTNPPHARSFCVKCGERLKAA